MENVHPFIHFEDIQIDKKANQECCEAHQEKPYHKEDIGRLRMFAHFFFLFHTAGNKIDSYHKHDGAHHIAQDDYKQAGSSEPIEHYGGKQQRQVTDYQYKVLKPAKLIIVATQSTFLRKHMNE